MRYSTINSKKQIISIYRNKSDYVKYFESVFKENIRQHITPGIYKYRAYPFPMLINLKPSKNTRKYIRKLNLDVSSVYGKNYFLKSAIKKLVNLAFLKKIKITSDLPSGFGGDLILFKNSNRSIKILNFNKMKVLTYFLSEIELNFVLENIALTHSIKNSFHSVFKDDCYIIEKLIDYDPIKNLTTTQVRNVLKKYLTDLSDHLNSKHKNTLAIIKTTEYINVFYHYLDKIKQVSKIKEKLDMKKLLETMDSLIFINIKGDNSFNNFLIKGDNYYLIDFESHSYQSLFYLVITYHSSLSIKYNWSQFLIDYKIGYFDKFIEQVFESLDIVFNEQLRDEYYFISLLDFNFFNENKLLNTDEIKNLDQKLALQIAQNFRHYLVL